ncbi:MAG: hypothetical protein Kow0056_15690 [Coriobacteriia bacterium]
MKNHRYSIFGITLGLAALTGAWALDSSQQVEPGALLVFLVAFLVIEALAIDFPRGDVHTLSAPVTILASVFLGLPAAAVVVGLGVPLVWFATRRRTADRCMTDAITRGFAIVGVSRIGIIWVGTTPVSSKMLASLAVVGTVGVVGDLVVSQVQSALRRREPIGQMLLGGARLQWTILLAEVSAVAVGGVLYPHIGVWGLFAVCLILLVVRQAFSLYLSVKRTYEATIDALSRTAEYQKRGQRGHVRRVTRLSTEVGRRLGWTGARLERLSHVAMLHELGELRAGESAGEEPADQVAASEILQDVSFLKGAV